MYEATRQGDHVEHSFALEGLLTGLAVGLLVGVICVATCGAGLAVIATAAAVGGGLGEGAGHLFHHHDEAIDTGASKVQIGQQWAARAKADQVDQHQGQVIAQGSRTVFIQDFPAARIGDKTECDGKIAEGCSTVQIGREPGTYVKIGREVPLWLEIGVQVLGLVGMVGELAMASEAVEALAESESVIAGSESAMAESEAAIAESEAATAESGAATAESEAATAEKPGAPGESEVTPPEKAPPNAEEEPPAGNPEENATSPEKPATEGESTPGESSSAPEKQCTEAGHPVNVATGDVVDRAVDLSLPGLIPVIFKRSYSSARSDDHGSLGPGWAHSFEQWVVDDGSVITLRDEEGRDIYFERLSEGKSTFHRRERLTLSLDASGAYLVYSATTRLSRNFASRLPGGRAVLRSIRDAHGNAVTLYYDDDDRLECITDAAGRELRLQNDQARQIARVEAWARGELQQWVDYEYHSEGELASAINALGDADRFEYDNRHRMARVTLKNGVSFQYAYDPDSGRCVRTWGDNDLRLCELRFDLVRRRTEIRGNERPTVYWWNQAGVVVREETIQGECLLIREFDRDLYLIAEGPTPAEFTRYEYDVQGNRTKVIDAAGNITTWVYKNDQPCKRVAPDGLVTDFEHDARGALQSIAYPSGLRYELDHDLHGRLVGVRDAEDALIRFSHDSEHNVIAEVDGRGAATIYSYDPLGRPTTQTDELGRTTIIEYDLLRRPISLHAADGSVTQAEYEPLGNIARTVDALGQITEMEYAGTGVLTRLVHPNGEAWTLRYDRDEWLREIKNPGAEVYSFEYDAGGRIRQERTFDGRCLRYHYSEAGRLAIIDYPDSTFRAFKHDPLGNLLSEDSRDGGIVFQRDKLGRLGKAVLQERDGKVVTEFKRDKLGRIVSETQNGQSIQYAYDEHSRRTKRILPGGATTVYSYDRFGALVGVEHDGHRFAFDRDKLGRETSRRPEDGSFEIRSSYDEMDRLVERAATGGRAHAALSRRTWKYDALGRVFEIGDTRWGATQYQYDSIGQLIKAVRGAYHENFQYDVTGSLRNVLNNLSRDEDALPWKTAPGNLLTETNEARYDYDARGRRVRKVALSSAAVNGAQARAEEVTEYVWDERDRLREVKLPDGDRVLFTYDVFGRRVRKEVVPCGDRSALPRRVVGFLWDGDVLASDMDSTQGARVFVHEPRTFVPLLQVEQGEVFAVVNDHLGMPKELIDQDGRVAWSAVHSAWGELVETWQDPVAQRQRRVESPFRLLGQYADKEIGLRYTRFRYFDAESGRWCSPDPLGFYGGPNLFGFNGAPLCEIDPLGLYEGIYWFYDQKAPGKIYVGQSSDVERRLAEHVRSGRLSEGELELVKTNNTKIVDGGKFAREIQEQNKITEEGGINGGKLSNKVNPIGESREEVALENGLEKPVIRGENCP